MSSGMTPIEVSMLLAQFSVLPESGRPNFLRQHPEIRSVWVVDWALTAARLRDAMGEPEAKMRLAGAALYIATELDDHERQTAARALLAEHSDQDREHSLLRLRSATNDGPFPAEEQIAHQVGDDQPLPPRHLPQSTKALIASAAELTEKPSLRTGIRVILSHPGLIPQALKTAAGFIFALLKDPVQGQQQINQMIAETLDEASLARARKLAQRARLEGDEDTAQRLERLPAGIEALRDQLSSVVNKVFTFEVFDMLCAVASAGSEGAARQVVREQVRLALQSEFLPALMQIQDQFSQLPDPPPYPDAFCALILDEINRTLAEMEPKAIGIGGACTALLLADTPRALEVAIARYQPLIDEAFFAELERMAESFAERGLPRFATLARMLVDPVRQQVSQVDREPVPRDLDAHMLALLRVSLATTVEEAWAAVEEEPGLLSENAIQPIREQVAFREMLGDLATARRLREVADWLTHWRSELADPENNIVSRLAERVRASELTLEAALAELEGPGALAGLSGPHLGAVDERVIALRMQDLGQAEILAALNDAAARKIRGAKIRAYTAISLAELRISRGAGEEALQVLKEVMEQARQTADPRLELRFLGTQGLAYQELGRPREAATCHWNALDLARQMESESDQMPSLNSLGYIYGVLGETEQALTYLREGYAIARRLGNRQAEAQFLGTMAMLSQQTGQFGKAVEQLAEAIRFFREAGDRDNEARALGNLGEAYIDLGALEKARKHLLDLSNWGMGRRGA